MVTTLLILMSSALNLNGAVIEDAAGNAASFSFSGELASAAAIVIDTTAPAAPTC